MADTSFRVTRKELAAFLRDPRTIRAFELAIGNANELLPSQVEELTTLLEGASLAAEVAGARAAEALASLHWIAESLAQIAVAGPRVNPAQVDELQKLADGWFPNWTTSTKSAVVRNINADAALTITTTSAGAGITIDSADATGTTASGSLLITTGNTVNQEPGNITIQPGAPSGTAAASTGADVNIIGSAGWRFGGGVFEAGGDALNTGVGFSTGGSFGMTAGAGKKQGGTVAVESGPCNGASGNGGDATLKPNTGAGAGVDGRSILYDAYGNEVFATGTVSLGGASGFAFMGAAITAQSTGWGYPSGTTTKTTFDTATVTTSELAERVKGLIEDMLDRGYLGA